MKKFLLWFSILGLLITKNFVLASTPFFVPASPIIPSNEWFSSDKENCKSDDELILDASLETSEWNSAPISFESRKLYRYSFNAFLSGDEGNICACAGTSFFNYDYRDLGQGRESSKTFSEVFFVPEGEKGVRKATARFAKWESRRAYAYSMPEIIPVQPVFKLLRNNKNRFVPLGEGEVLDEDGSYRFSIFPQAEITNYDRPLYLTNAHYNTNRWIIGKGTEVVYRLALEQVELRSGVFEPCAHIPFVSGTIDINVGYYQCGKLIAEVSCDNIHWEKIGEVSCVSTPTFSLDSFLVKKPSELFIRLRGADISEEISGCSLQIYGLSTNLQTEQDNGDFFIGRGKTIFADVLDEIDEDRIDALIWGVDDEDCVWGYEKDTYKALKMTWGESRGLTRVSSEDFKGAKANNGPQNIPYEASFKRPMRLFRRVYPYFEQNYTKGITGITILDELSTGSDVSWCEPDYKVPLDPNSRVIQDDVLISVIGAKNDVESFQVVLHAGDKSLNDVKATIIGEVKSDSGSVIPIENVKIRYAYYHFVDKPTDVTCATGWYPDALVPFEQGSDGLGSPITVLPQQNLPIWVTIVIDSEVEAGTYQSTLMVTANNGNFSATIPFTCVVYNFTLPKKNTLETAYGLSYSHIDVYHNLKTIEDKRNVYEKYFKLFSDYRISMYDPVPLDHIRVEWNPEADPPCCNIDFSLFDAEIKRVFNKYNFTNFCLPFLGLGGGTYQNRYEGTIAGFKSGTYEYESMFADYGSKMQEHLEKIGVLDAAYIYCFDEPEEKDYEFVAGEFGKLQKYAPKINRMLTEEPSQSFSRILSDNGASVDIWCPVSPFYSNESSVAEREKGNRFWWYVCCFPKAPYCTEFTDHPAIELRLWHWQTFERNISGCLVWLSNYWTSSTAFPNSFQNPYKDPACYVSDYLTPSGTKLLWGNGDGRFIYPPLSASVPEQNGGKPIFDEPCASIRWEMIREGVEDYEMLTILKELLKAKDCQLSSAERDSYNKLFDFSSFTENMTTFSCDPQMLRSRRLEVMKAIVELEKK